MTSPALLRKAGWSEGRCVADRWGFALPSLSDLAFVIPLGVIFSCASGVGWLLTDSDTGWHIRTGEWILRNKQIPTRDLFSFTRPGQPWLAWEWLTDLFMGLLHSCGGLAGVVLGCLVVLCMTSFLVYRATRSLSGHRFVALGVTSLAMAACRVHWLARPHLVTPLFLAVFSLVLNRAEKNLNTRVLPILAVLTVLWANLHGGFFLGIVVLLTHGIGAVVEKLLGNGGERQWLRARAYFVTAGLCAMASLLNPYGYRLHIHIAEYVSSSFYFEHIDELQSLGFHSFSAAPFETMLILAIGAAFWHLLRGRAAQVILLLSWSHLGLLAARNIPPFAVLCAPGIGLAVAEWLDLGRARSSNERLGNLFASFEKVESGIDEVAARSAGRIHLVPVVAVLGLALVLAHPGRVKSLQAEFDSRLFPVDAAAALRHLETDRETRVFCSWQWGGYLIYQLWPQMKVFNDGRTDFYGPEIIRQAMHLWTLAPDWPDILEQYRITAALVPVDSALAWALKNKNEWRAVYHDQVAVVFERLPAQRNTSECRRGNQFAETPELLSGRSCQR